jgi:exonuclease III
MQWAKEYKRMLYFSPSMTNAFLLNIMTWNVRGLNDRSKRIAVRKQIMLHRPHIITLQETKLGDINRQILNESVGRSYDCELHNDAQGTAGGILAVWKSEMFTKLAQMQGRYTISVDLAMNMDNIIFRLTIVYGPTNTNERANFYAELQQAKPNNNIPWMVAGDMNVTLQLRDKSNTQHTSLDMRSFQHIVNSLELLDLQLQGRKYTWCNEREVPSYVRLDRFLISVEWTRMFPNTIQKTLPNTSSDHYPLMCTSATKFPCANIFRIENNWLKQQDFIQMVNEMWHQQPIASSPQELHHKMVQTRKAIIKWKKEKGNAWPHQLQVCNEWL